MTASPLLHLHRDSPDADEERRGGTHSSGAGLGWRFPGLGHQLAVPRPVLQSVFFGLIVLVGCLQISPRPVFRDPVDRTWISWDSNRSQLIVSSL
ncbi:hypothetical protein GW17_00042349 [Ensete ventricosum]|nr:hypothetical protein GW17_00042349 [Ensete ventricosum]